MKDLDDKIESEKQYIEELKKLSQNVIQFYCSRPQNEPQQQQSQSETEPIISPSSPPIVVPKRKIIVKLK